MCTIKPFSYNNAVVRFFGGKFIAKIENNITGKVDFLGKLSSSRNIVFLPDLDKDFKEAINQVIYFTIDKPDQFYL